LGTGVNPDTIGYLWTGEFDLNTLRVDGEIFESGKKKLRIQKYPDSCGRGLSCSLENESLMIFFTEWFQTRGEFATAFNLKKCRHQS